MRKLIKSTNLTYNLIKRPFNKTSCLAQLFIDSQKTEDYKKFKPALITLEAYDYYRILALKSFIEDTLIKLGSSDPANSSSLINQHKVLTKILSLDNGSFFFIENGYFYRIMLYGYAFQVEIGRLYSLSTSPQWLKKNIKYLLFERTYVDVGLENAHPAILSNYSRSEKLNTPLLTELVKNRTTFYSKLSEEIKIDASSIRIIVLKCLNQTQQEFDYANLQSPILKAFFKEVLLIRDVIWDKFDKNFYDFILEKKTAYWKNKSLSNKKVSIQSYFCQTEESKLLLDLFEFLKGKDDLNNNIPMLFIPFFDGAYVKYNSPSLQMDIPMFLEEYNKKNESIQFKIKTFEEETSLLNLETLKKYINLEKVFQKLDHTKSRKVLEHFNLKYKGIEKEMYQSIVDNANLLKSTNKSLTKEITRIKKQQKSSTITDEITDKLSHLLTQRKETYVYRLSIKEKKAIRFSVYSIMYKLREKLLPHATDMESLETYIEQIITKTEVSES